MRSFLQFILEGGNVKIGATAAQRIKINPKNREHVASDIHDTLGAIHDSFHKETGHHLFGKDKAALKDHSAFSGSTKHLFNKKISHTEFAKHKPSVGDVDAAIPHEHKEALEKHLAPGKKFGKYKVVGIQRGFDTSAVMTHENGEHHQFDFESTHYHNNKPTKHDQFLHSSDWHDTKHGFAGAHHKQLINAAGGEKHKLTPQGGLKSRTDKDDPGIKDPDKISHKLFGAKADHSKIHSFHGTAELVKKHIPQEHHQAIYDKFVSGAKKNLSNAAAIKHLGHTLGIHDKKGEIVKEAHEPEHHASVIPMVGFSPISHMGHAKDLGSSLKNLPGHKHVGVSQKADLFDPKERQSILHKQWQHGDETRFHATNSGGETVGKAFHELPAHGKKHLHILVGHDRKDFANGLKSSLEAGKVKEMNGHKWDSITVHHPEDTMRTHGMSGTKMRDAAGKDDIKTFHKHLGPMFKDQEAHRIMKKIGNAIKTKQIKVKRPN